MFDITNPVSFEHLTNWKNNFIEKAMPKDPASFPFFVFGNKKDREADRSVRPANVKEWLKKNNNIPFEETSALDSHCIEKAFDSIAQKLLNNTLAAKTEVTKS